MAANSAYAVDSGHAGPPMVVLGGGPQTVVVTEGSRKPPSAENDLTGIHDWHATLFDVCGDCAVCKLFT